MEEHNRLILEAGVDPVFDGLRADPGFVDLVRLALDPDPVTPRDRHGVPMTKPTGQPRQP